MKIFYLDGLYSATINFFKWKPLSPFIAMTPILPWLFGSDFDSSIGDRNGYKGFNYKYGWFWGGSVYLCNSHIILPYLTSVDSSQLHASENWLLITALITVSLLVFFFFSLLLCFADHKPRQGLVFLISLIQSGCIEFEYWFLLIAVWIFARITAYFGEYLAYLLLLKLLDF